MTDRRLQYHMEQAAALEFQMLIMRGGIDVMNHDSERFTQETQSHVPAVSHSANPQDQGIEAALLLAQFQLLNPYGRRVALAMVAGLARLDAAQ